MVVQQRSSKNYEDLFEMIYKCTINIHNVMFQRSHLTDMQNYTMIKDESNKFINMYKGDSGDVEWELDWQLLEWRQG